MEVVNVLYRVVENDINRVEGHAEGLSDRVDGVCRRVDGVVKDVSGLTDRMDGAMKDASGLLLLNKKQSISINLHTKYGRKIWSKPATMSPLVGVISSQ